MGQQRPPAINGTTITAITLGVIGLLMVIVLFPGAKVVGALLGAGAIVVGGLAAVNARRAGVSLVLPLVGAALGLVAVVWMIVVAATV